MGEQKIVTLHSRGKLTPSQQNQLIREDPEIPQLLETLQEVLSRPLTPYETEGFLYLYNGLRLSSSYLLLAAQYSREQGKDSIRQIERLVTGWVEKGIDTYDDAETEIKRLARRQGNEGKIRELFGIRDRNLSAKEKDYIEHWFTDLGYGEEIIKLAYDRTVDNTGKAAFPYLNRILNRWQEKGVRTPEEAMAEMESGSKAQRGKPGQQTAAPESSFDLSEIRRLMEENSGG
ncbi:MAG: DnaD domain protein [Angelakisella sp.]|nr:DnaD domain protein [Angelakisella sp.]